MATRDDIRDYDDVTLDTLERELVRAALSINGRSGDAVYDDSNDRMDALSAVQNQMMRKYLSVDLLQVEEDRDVRIAGSSDGTNYTPAERDNWVQREMRRMLYPDLYNDPTLQTNQPRSLISYVPITYETGSAEFD